MITDDERREIAGKLRSMKDYETAGVIVRTLLGLEPGELMNDVVRRRMSDRVADLVEPTPSCEFWDAEGRECYCVRTVRPVDRGTLLALADGLDKDADNIISAARNAQFTGGRPRMGEAKNEAYKWRSIARRIREALGVEDDHR